VRGKRRTSNKKKKGKIAKEKSDHWCPSCGKKLWGDPLELGGGKGKRKSCFVKKKLENLKRLPEKKARKNDQQVPFQLCPAKGHGAC